MAQNNSENVKIAGGLIDDFLARTGISDPAGNPRRRYLWTDAFAVQSCFALSHVLNRDDYFRYALKLIDQVHLVLGKHRIDDERKGWISGLPEEEGLDHPTIGGLRIGKDLPERTETEPFNQQLEWERDGQYFHYLTRWFNALVLAYDETNDKKYALWAVELIKAGSSFIVKSNGRIRMAWKMNTDLTEPAVETMGAHDPMEGLISVIRGMLMVPEKKQMLKPFKNDLEMLCRNMNWFTNDPLGIGGLLINAERTAVLKLIGKSLPESIQPDNLFASGLQGLEVFAKDNYSPRQPAKFRLAFRECGLTTGIHVLYNQKQKYLSLDLELDKLSKFIPLVTEIENFWIKPENQLATTWIDHLDINAVTLASSLLAHEYPRAY
ncbi:MAG: hypothetical protein ACOCVA_00430 [Prolixibacteraceae bacterium]